MKPEPATITTLATLTITYLDGSRQVSIIPVQLPAVKMMWASLPTYDLLLPDVDLLV